MLVKIPRGYSEIVKTYGEPGKVRLARIEPPYTLFYDGNPLKTISVHELLTDNLMAVLQEVKALGLAGELNDFSGCYNVRPIRGGRKPSTHSWGIAVDFEAQRFPLGSSKRMRPKIVEAFKKFGAMYGGDFSRKDPMHFQWALGY